MTGKSLDIAISGAGVAGPTLAWWLMRAGHRPVLIERAPHLRTRGYVIDFWGHGYTIAERMGVLPAIREAGYAVEEVRLVDRHGRKAGGFGTDVFRRAVGERFTTLPRGDLAAALYQALGPDIEALFGTTIASLDEHPDGVRVLLSTGEERDFDLVIGADGLHSNVRELAFGGSDGRFERQLGYHVAAFETMGYAPRDELVYVSHAEPGRQIARFAERGDRTLFLTVFADRWMIGAEPESAEERKRALMLACSGMSWEWPRIAEELAVAEDVYFDRVSQIHLPSWSRGRVALVGDAAAAVSLLAGEGAGLGMIGAYVLACELAACEGDYRRAFETYEKQLRRFVESKQRSARKFARSFAPDTAFGIWFRNQATKLFGVPWIAERLIGDIRDDLPLPRFPCG